MPANTRTYPQLVVYVAPAPATPKQIDFISALLGSRNLTVEDRPKFSRRVAQLAGDPRAVEQLSRVEASAFIDYLRELPILATTTAASPEDVPDGRYAVEIDGQLVFVKVDVVEFGKWAGWTFVSQQVSDDFIRMSRDRQNAALDQVRQDGAERAATRYGRELGVCGVCARTLTNENSREAGIGPVCRAKSGW